jgi:prophage regulatory protein
MEGNQSLPVLFSHEDVCRLIGISKRTLYRLVSAGEFPGGIKVGAKRVWHPGELDTYLRQASQVKPAKAR